MLFDSQLITAASGSVGGITASHNRGGKYFRARVTPTDPNTTRQQLIRALVADISGRWNSTLTEAQRQAWRLYSDNVPLPGPLGKVRPVGGLPMYIRSNIARRNAGLPRVDDAPTVFDVARFTPITNPAATALTNRIQFDFDQFDPWVLETNSAMILFSSPAQNPSITFYKGPYRFGDLVLGSEDPPPSPPANLAAGFLITQNTRVFFRVVAVRADGRVSASQQQTAIATLT